MRKKIIQFLLEIRKLLRDKFHQYNEHLPFIITLFIVLLLVVFGINIFISLTETLHSDALAKYDSKVTEFIISFRTPTRNKFLQFITEVGDFNGYLVMAIISTIIFYLKFKNWRYVGEIFFVLIVSGLSNVALKQVINRARPDADHLVSVATLSYPSGHAMSAIAFYGFLIYLVYTFKLKAWLKAGLILLFVFLIITIGISRVYLGVHYPSDIVGGYIAGFIWVLFCIVLFHIIDLLRKRRKNRKVKVTD